MRLAAGREHGHREAAGPAAVPGPGYPALLNRIGGGVEVHLLDRMKGERDLSWIAKCARTEVLLHPEWSVMNVLPPAAGGGGTPGGCDPLGGGNQIL